NSLRFIKEWNGGTAKKGRYQTAMSNTRSWTTRRRLFAASTAVLRRFSRRRNWQRLPPKGRAKTRLRKADVAAKLQGVRRRRTEPRQKGRAKISARIRCGYLL